ILRRDLGNGHLPPVQTCQTKKQKFFTNFLCRDLRNYVLLTYASIAMIILYFKLRPKRQAPAVTEK
uniref:ATP synthase membrane subunit DAPIT n=1 Tax=Chelydra serpentina TaxID=8475 RepID=A0A8C3XKN1_CHESE